MPLLRPGTMVRIKEARASCSRDRPEISNMTSRGVGYRVACPYCLKAISQFSKGRHLRAMHPSEKRPSDRGFPGWLDETDPKVINSYPQLSIAYGRASQAASQTPARSARL